MGDSARATRARRLPKSKGKKGSVLFSCIELRNCRAPNDTLADRFVVTEIRPVAAVVPVFYQAFALHQRPELRRFAQRRPLLGRIRLKSRLRGGGPQRSSNAAASSQR